MSVSVTSVYNKLNGMEANVSAELVRETGASMEAIVRHLKGNLPDWLPGYRLKILDGNAIAASEHRLKPLRNCNSAPLPGQSLVVLDPSLMLAIDVFPCEDGHAQERSLLNMEDEVFVESEILDYRIASCCGDYGGVHQRWLIIESEKRRNSDLKQLEKRLTKQLKTATNKLRSLMKQDFACVADAKQASDKLSRSLKYHCLESVEIKTHAHCNKAGRPTKNQSPERFTYRVTAQVIPVDSVIEIAQRQAGRFILATNVLDEEILSNDEVLAEYKGQQSSERGFRFLKDPLFFTSSVFLNTPRRVAALAMVMGLCLLVYTLGQRQLRQALTHSEETIPNQLKKPTSTPTLRWVFQCFQAVHLVHLNHQLQVSNLTDTRLRILRFLGNPCQQYYLICRSTRKMSVKSVRA